MGMGFELWMVVVFWVFVVFRVEPDVDVGESGYDSDPKDSCWQAGQEHQPGYGYENRD